MRPSALTRRASTSSSASALRRSPRRSRSCRRKVEDTLDVGLAGAGANDPRPRAPAEEQVEGVGEHGLAGARLAGEHVQAGREPQLRLLDQQQVLDTKLLEHVSRCSSARGRIATEVNARARGWRGTGRVR